MKIKNISKINKGFTIVELVVTFALFSIFIVAILTVMSGSTRTYYHERQTMAAYTVADGVLSEIQNDVQTMLGKDQKGYMKIRQADGTKIPNSGTTSTISGPCLELVTSNNGNSCFAEQISTNSFTGELIDGQNYKLITSKAINVNGNYLTKVYYGAVKNETATISDLFANKSISDSILSKSSYSFGTDQTLASDAIQPLSDEFYQGYTVTLNFEIKPRAQRVNYIKATVNVNKTDKLMYSKTKYLYIENNVNYTNLNTLYSEGANSGSVPTSYENDVVFKYNGKTLAFNFNSEDQIKQDRIEKNPGAYEYSYVKGNFYEWNGSIYYCCKDLSGGWNADPVTAYGWGNLTIVDEVLPKDSNNNYYIDTSSIISSSNFIYLDNHPINFHSKPFDENYDYSNAGIKYDRFVASTQAKRGTIVYYRSQFYLLINGINYLSIADMMNINTSNIVLLSE